MNIPVGCYVQTSGPASCGCGTIRVQDLATTHKLLVGLITDRLDPGSARKKRLHAFVRARRLHAGRRGRACRLDAFHRCGAHNRRRRGFPVRHVRRGRRRRHRPSAAAWSSKLRKPTAMVSGGGEVDDRGTVRQQPYMGAGVGRRGGAAARIVTASTNQRRGSTRQQPAGRREWSLAVGREQPTQEPGWRTPTSSERPLGGDRPAAVWGPWWSVVESVGGGSERQITSSSERPLRGARPAAVWGGWSSMVGSESGWYGRQQNFQRRRRTRTVLPMIGELSASARRRERPWGKRPLGRACASAAPTRCPARGGFGITAR